MKPKGWEKLSKKKKQAYAVALLNSIRGSYIIGQALGKAIKFMNAVPKPMREVSNIEDMEVLKMLFICID